MRKITLLLLIVYAALSLYNIIGVYGGIPYQPFFTPLLTLLGFVFAMLHGWQYLGWKRTLLLLFLTFSVSLLFESVGVATGLVYGSYHYTDKLGARFLGLVPYLIPLAWFMMTYPSYIIASRLMPAQCRVWLWRLLVAAVGAVIMTAWDLAMDPLMVGGGHWVWEAKGAYFGVPLQNYWGWWLTVCVTFILFLALGRVRARGKIGDARFEGLAIWSYAITGLTSVVVDLRVTLGGPGLVGMFAMAPWVILAFRSTSSEERKD